MFEGETPSPFYETIYASESGADDEQAFEVSLERVHAMLISEYPFLEQVDVSVLILDPIIHEHQIRGAHYLPEMNHTQTIEVNLGGQTHLEDTKKTRGVSVEIVSKLFGIKPEEMTAELFDIFVYIHEFGHAFDFQTNYVQNEDLKDLTDDQLAFAWRNEYMQQKAELPIPNMGAAEFLEELKSTPFEIMLDEDPALRDRLTSLGLHTVDEVVRAQDRSYRAMRAETFADQFAADFIKSHMPEIIDDIERIKDQP